MPVSRCLLFACVLLISAVLVSSQDSSDSGTAGRHGPAPVHPQPPTPPMVPPPQPQHPHHQHDGSGSLSSSGSHSSDTDGHTGPTHASESDAPGGNSQHRLRRDANKAETSSDAGLYVGVALGVVVVIGLLCGALVVYRRVHRATPTVVANIPPTDSSETVVKATVDHSPYAAERGDIWVALNGEEVGSSAARDVKQLSIVMGRLASHSRHQSAAPVTGILLPRIHSPGYPIEAWCAAEDPAKNFSD